MVILVVEMVGVGKVGVEGAEEAVTLEVTELTARRSTGGCD